MTMQEPNWKEVTGSSADHIRQRSRNERRRMRQLFYWGVYLLVVAAGLVLLGVAIGLPVVYLPGIAVGCAGGVLCATGGVVRYRLVGHLRTTPVVQSYFGPPEAEADKIQRELERTRVEAWLQQVEEPSPVKIRCLSCNQLNDEAAHFCQHCGSLLQSDRSG